MSLFSTTVFVSGCFDILHGGHVEFLFQARKLGTYLIVCAAPDHILEAHKGRRPVIPLEHRLVVLRALSMVDEVVLGEDTELGFNFKTQLARLKPDVLAVTEDDRFEVKKRVLCEQLGIRYVMLPKTLDFAPISTTQITQALNGN